MTEPLLRVEALTKHFPVRRGVFGRVTGQVRAVDGVSFDILPGETLGLVGESGCGKTTVGRSVLRLVEPTSGRVTFDGVDVTRASAPDLTRLRRHMQVVFQDPFSSLNPRLRVVDIVGEALEYHGLAQASEVERKVADLLRRVGLSPSWINRYPHEFSGGQRQRIGIARAIALEPKLVVCDEAVSALDVSIQAQILNLFIELRREMGLSYLFIAHDLSVVRHVSHRIAVMYLGQIVELCPAGRLFEAPAHPYTRALLSAIPVPKPGAKRRRLVLTGDVPSPLDPPSGCRFHTRCPAVMDRCRGEAPPEIAVEENHPVACFHAEGLGSDADWARRIGERIDAKIAENAKNPNNAAHDAERPSTLHSATVRAPEKSGQRKKSMAAAPDRGRIATFGVIAAAAFFVVVFGHPWLGIAGGAAAYLGRLRSRFSSKRIADASFVLAVALSLVIGAAVERFGKRRAARRELEQLSAEIEGRAKTTGAYPERLTDLGWRLYPLSGGGDPRDPWGRSWRYRAPGAEDRPFDLGSTGPDGVPSGDDIGRAR